MKKTVIKIGILAVVLTATTIKANAQANPGGPGTVGSGTQSNGTPAPAHPAGGAPIDGGVSLLAAAGVAYACKKFAKKKQQQEV